MLFFNISSLNSKITWYDPNLVPITLHWSKWPFHTRARKSIPLYNKCQGRRATYNLWQSKHYLQMKSPVTRAPRQFLHDGSCLCLWLWWGIFLLLLFPTVRPQILAVFLRSIGHGTFLAGGWVGTPESPLVPWLAVKQRKPQFPSWLVNCHCHPSACLAV